jgi:BlaI family transcriptional regulator, penicillinase repressor
MTPVRISKFELQLLEKLWELGPSAVRDIQESLPETDRPAYTTVQTMMYRLEEKGVVRRTKKIGNAHIFEAIASRQSVHHRLIDELLNLFGGSSEPVVSRLVETGKLTLSDIKEIEKKLTEVRHD